MLTNHSVYLSKPTNNYLAYEVGGNINDKNRTSSINVIFNQEIFISIFNYYLIIYIFNIYFINNILYIKF